MDIIFCLYGEKMEHVSFLDLKETNDCVVRVEDSGSEGFYCEVAKWNPRIHKLQRYAFAKFLGGEIDGLGAFKAANHVATALNKKWKANKFKDINLKSIHGLDDWNGSEK